MDIELLEKIKSASSEALSGRKKLLKLHARHIERMNSGRMTRATTTTYNSRTASIMETVVTPNENILKELLK